MRLAPSAAAIMVPALAWQEAAIAIRTFVTAPAKPAPASMPLARARAGERAAVPPGPTFAFSRVRVLHPTGADGSARPTPRAGAAPPPWAQAKLAIGTVDDPLEREADLLA